MSRQTTLQNWRGFASGERIVMLIETKGATADDEEIAYPLVPRLRLMLLLTLEIIKGTVSI